MRANRSSRIEGIRLRATELAIEPEPAKEVKFEHGLTEDQQRAVLEFNVHASGRFNDMQYEGMHLAAVSLVLPDRLEEVEKDFFGRTSFGTFARALNRGGQFHSQDYDLMLSWAQIGQPISAMERRTLLESTPLKRLRESRSHLRSHSSELPLALMHRIMFPEEPPITCDDSGLYRELVRDQFALFALSCPTAMYLRMIHPERDLINDLETGGFSMRSFEEKIIKQQKVLQEKLNEVASGGATNTATEAFILTELLALKALLTADAVRVGSSGRVECTFLNEVVKERSLPPRTNL
ncbi:MAG: hypothetical protein COW24_03950 [Candidatus Kerfeldbacteria bacterium CG15_BIG_FIL_POST_REV_8_21_14_020_45_12]|uniref:Uncharacterized protein n=1 Tax=Candidatus Kerfeldbacteria bacterium CG15_BIG_FIL_POST_REV_8_21_14_020_45_12 TaxID=2014247 RepID=A0A2M7H375_9BACT|nr:MAG: hypothetical protein COW24_03950 [Candidatus Kerfeldbacteria bacterium CG15_BIG_FIL_POST_REV_8_21_14_020_45_12]PJA93840.1 MAG: hypothetical protein CO132_01095 [Candidatus Kerfeldbacteria bacterium CG_4_9_14_3_um_filter_45_8]